jgi:hypothetical protein
MLIASGNFARGSMEYNNILGVASRVAEPEPDLFFMYSRHRYR